MGAVDMNYDKSRRKFIQRSLGIAAASLLESPSKTMSFPLTPFEDTSHSALLMSAAADAFIKSLSADQRDKASFGFEDQQRFDWHYIPRDRKGVPFKELD